MLLKNHLQVSRQEIFTKGNEVFVFVAKSQISNPGMPGGECQVGRLVTLEDLNYKVEINSCSHPVLLG